MGLFRWWFGEQSRRQVKRWRVRRHRKRLSNKDVATPCPMKACGYGKQAEDSRIRVKIQDLLDTAINPAVAGHGGVVTLFDVKGRWSTSRWGVAARGAGWRTSR